MVHLSALSLALNRPGAVGLTLEQAVAALFANNEQGAWYDPSDRSTLFQDSAGTLPVTEVEQPVGLMLDRRKGLAVSTNAGNASATGQFTTPSAAANQVTGDIDIRARAILQSWASGSTQSMVTKRDSGGSNMGYALRVNTTGELSLIFGTSSTTFATATSSAATGFAANSTNWIRVTRNSSTGDVLFYTSANGSTWSQLGTTISTASGNIYASTSALIVGTGSGFAEPCVGKIYRAQVYAGAVLQVDFDPTRYAGGSTFVAATGETWTLAGTTGSITPDGNHAYQTTSSARPHLRSRYNLLTYSEQFDQGRVFTNIDAFGSGSVANALTAPDGTTTADFIRPTTTSGNHIVRQTFTAVTGASTFSCYIKAGGYSKAMLYDATAAKGYGFDLTSSGSKSAVTGITETSASDIQDVGSGWYRCSISAESTADVRVYVLNAFSGFSFAGNGTSGIYVWGAQLNLGSTAMSYQRIAAAPTLSTPPTYATTSTMGGEVFRPYLFFDGGDKLVTAAIDYSGSDKLSVCCGAYKSADSTSGTVYEVGNYTTPTSGSLTIGHSSNQGDASRRTWFASMEANSVATLGAAAIYAAPDTRVLTAVYDRAQATTATEIVLRVDGVQQTLSFSSANVATGNFANAVTAIGRRSDDSIPMNGHLFGLIARGGASDASAISTLESYIAQKTGVTL